jgi:hypothetical protein
MERPCRKQNTRILTSRHYKPFVKEPIYWWCEVGYTGESKCVRCQQKATQVRTRPFFKLECLRPKTAQRGHLNLDVQTDTGIKIHGRPETFGRPRQVNNLAHLKTDIL